MHSTEIASLAHRRLKPLHIVCGAFIATVIIVSLIPWLGLFSQPFETSMVIGMVVMMVGALVVSQVLRGALFRPRILGNPEHDIQRAVTSLFLATIVSFSVLEWIAILGMLVAGGTGYPVVSIVTGVVTVLAMLGSWPKVEQIVKAVERGRAQP